LAWLQALDPIWVDFPVPEATIGKLSLGSQIELVTDAYPGQVFKGEVEAFDAKLGQDTRTLMVRARLPNPDRKLLPGMFANVAVLAGGAKQYVTVPRTAVTYGLYGDSVWVVKQNTAKPVAPGAPTASAEPVGSAIAADNAPTGAVPAGNAPTAERRFVRVGPSEGDRIAILEGVQPGEEVVTSGQLKLQPGAAMRIDNSGALKPPVELPKQ
jgi:membrane fusion protein (multidrug efflux system)